MQAVAGRNRVAAEESTAHWTRQFDWRVEPGDLVSENCRESSRFQLKLLLGESLHAETGESLHFETDRQTGESLHVEIVNNTGETNATCQNLAKLTNSFCDLHDFYVKNSPIVPYRELVSKRSPC